MAESKAGSKFSIVDTHAHLDMKHFHRDRSEVIARALNSGVNTIISVGTDLESSKKAIELAENHPEVLATAGFHPHEASKVKEKEIAKLAEMARHSRVVALGEMGLDFYRNRSPREAQLRVLEWQLELAVKLDLPAVIHCRQAEKEMLPLLRDWTSRHKEENRKARGVIHCFNGETDTVKQYLDMGFYLSLGAYIGYPSSRPMYNAIRSIPEDKLVVETDCPFLSPQSYRGQRNEPAYVLVTVQSLAEIRGVSLEKIARETTQNAYRLFNIGQSEY